MTTITTASLIWPGMSATVDAFALNPLAEDFRSVSPAPYAQAVQRGGRPPKLFTGGSTHLPAFTASGIDPYWLTGLPFGVRHATAAVASEAAVNALIQRHGANPNARLDHPRLDEAISPGPGLVQRADARRTPT